MKTISVSVLMTGVLLIGLSFSNNEDKYESAEIYCQSIEFEFDKIASQYELDYQQVLPIIFPECLRYSEFSDQMETTTLEYFYVNFGADKANFSIGRFQMKPLFIETLEKDIELLQLTKTQKSKFNYGVNEAKLIRAERINRLTSSSWQIHYLCAFYKIMDQKTNEINWQNKAAKISYYAAAYNYGYSSSKKEIETWQKQAVFPYGKHGEPQPYSTIASDYYLKTFAYEN